MLFLVIAGKDGRDGMNGDVHYFINITSNKDCGVWATTIECQNAFAPIQYCALCGGQNICDYE